MIEKIYTPPNLTKLIRILGSEYVAKSGTYELLLKDSQTEDFVNYFIEGDWLNIVQIHKDSETVLLNHLEKQDIHILGSLVEFSKNVKWKDNSIGTNVINFISASYQHKKLTSALNKISSNKKSPKHKI